MFGAILGDIAGSRFEFTGNRVKPKDLFAQNCFTTDDTYLTEAVAESLMSGYRSIEQLKQAVLSLTIAQVFRYPDAGWGTRFLSWIENLVSATISAISSISTRSRRSITALTPAPAMARP